MSILQEFWDDLEVFLPLEKDRLVNSKCDIDHDFGLVGCIFTVRK